MREGGGRQGKTKSDLSGNSEMSCIGFLAHPSLSLCNKKSQPDRRTQVWKLQKSGCDGE